MIHPDRCCHDCTRWCGRWDCCRRWSCLAMGQLITLTVSPWRCYNNDGRYAVKFERATVGQPRSNTPIWSRWVDLCCHPTPSLVTAATGGFGLLHCTPRGVGIRMSHVHASTQPIWHTPVPRTPVTHMGSYWESPHWTSAALPLGRRVMALMRYIALAWRGGNNLVNAFDVSGQTYKGVIHCRLDLEIIPLEITDNTVSRCTL